MLVFSIHKWRLPQNSNHQSPTSYPNLSTGWIFYSGSSFYLLPEIYYWQWPRGFNNHLNSWLWILDLTLITETFLTNSYFTHFFIFPHKFSFFIVWHWLSQSLLEKLPRLGKTWTRKERIISIMLLYTLGREGHHWLISQTRIPVSHKGTRLKD